MASLERFMSFATAARHGNFARAARELGLSPSAVAKNVARLERQLGLRLFHRTTRQVSLTQDGRQLFERCQRIVDEVAALEDEASGARAAVRGVLRIDAPFTYGKQVVLPILQRLLTQHPELRLDLRLSDAYTDLIREGIDAVVRIGHLPDSRLVARLFDQQDLLVCASPRYLSQHGEPKTPDALTTHQCVVFRMPRTGRDRPWQFRRGRRAIDFHPESRVRIDDGEALVHAALTDMGLVQVPDYMVVENIKRGRLVEVLKPFRPTPTPISIVYPSQRHVPPRVKALVAALTQRLAR
jgi:LysR family transcriptional regulator for bpeEF and oprC